ncbi:MAG TPA: glycosyltransferase family 39 protein, partial [Verrucomicrobiae bacterium]|nr:glycosyltransferase family 39 protein [Verrucomicrobiae bacterium]
MNESVNERSLRSPLALLVGGILVFRLLYLYFMPLDLYPDEAYYWDWSRHLDWGYYSKPPLVAWVIALSTALFGHTTFAVKLPSTLLSVVPLVFLPALAGRMFGRREALWTAIVLAAVPETASLALFMSTDALLFSCWSIALYAFWRGSSPDCRGWGWWLAASLAAGVGSLGKQMMLVFVPLALVFLALSREDRRLFRDPRLWFFVFTPLLFLLPPVLWNMKMNWVTIEHTAHHFAKRGAAFAFLGTSGEFVGSQFLALSPLLFLVFLGLLPCMYASARGDRRSRYLAVFSLIPLLVVLLLSFRQKINLNWPAVFYQSGLLFLAAWGSGGIDCAGLASRLRRLFVPAVGVGVLLVLVAYSLPWALRPFGQDGGKYDTTARMKGWRELGERTA